MKENKEILGKRQESARTTTSRRYTVSDATTLEERPLIGSIGRWGTSRKHVARPVLFPLQEWRRCSGVEHGGQLRDDTQDGIRPTEQDDASFPPALTTPGVPRMYTTDPLQSTGKPRDHSPSTHAARTAHSNANALHAMS